MTKFEKDFDNWLTANYEKIRVGYPYGETNLKPSVRDFFTEYPDSMKWGVYVDFFNSVGIAVGVIAKYDGYVHWIKPSSLDRPMMFSSILPINDARKASLEKAIEIYNK